MSCLVVARAESRGDVLRRDHLTLLREARGKRHQLARGSDTTLSTSSFARFDNGLCRHVVRKRPIENLALEDAVQRGVP